MQKYQQYMQWMFHSGQLISMASFFFFFSCFILKPKGFLSLTQNKISLQSSQTEGKFKKKKLIKVSSYCKIGQCQKSSNFTIPGYADLVLLSYSNYFFFFFLAIGKWFIGSFFLSKLLKLKKYSRHRSLFFFLAPMDFC